MPGDRLGLGGLAVLLTICAPASSLAQPLRPAARAELHAPDAQWASLVGLFAPSGFPDGAAALAAWKAGDPNPGDRRLGKALEALIASLNPRMAEEFRSLNGARLVAWPGPLAWRWSLLFPSDDGTIRDLLLAQSITQGAPEPPLHDWTVDRLGPPGSPLAASGPSGSALALDRQALEFARDSSLPSSVPAPGPPGITWEVDPLAFNDQATLRERQVAAALLALGATRLRGHLRVEPDGLASTSRLETGSPTRRPRVVDPAWLDWIAADSAAALSLSIDPDPASWESLFQAADRSQRIDPANKDLAPLRLRLNLLATAAGFRPERDLYPRLAGLTASLIRAPGSGPPLGLLVLHCLGEPEAQALADEALPRLLRRQLGPPAGDSYPSRDLGPLRLARRGSDVVLALGLDPALPESNLRSHLESFWQGSRPDRLGLARPSLLASWGGASPTIAEALAKAPPVVWWGTTTPSDYRDEVRWTGLSAPLADFLRAEIGPSQEPRP